MHLLYVDESGAVADPKQTYFVLAGFSLFERQGFWLANQLDAITARFDPADPAAVELHGNPMLAGKGPLSRNRKGASALPSAAWSALPIRCARPCRKPFACAGPQESGLS